jgi:hypothetical protein
MKTTLGLTLLFGVFLTWLGFLNVGEKDYDFRAQNVKTLVYAYTNAAAKRGNLNSTIYEELKNTINIVGDFNIEVIATKFEANGSKTIINGTSAIDFDLAGNDFDLLTIYVEDQNDLFLNKVYDVTPGGAIETNYKVVAKATSYIQR